MTKHKSLHGLIKRANGDERILAVLLFGSVARLEGREDSDIDVCLVLEPGLYTPFRLSEIKLEYLRDFDLDIQLFQQLPLYIRKRVLKDGKVLFARDMDRLYEVAFSFITEYADYEPVYLDYLREVTSAG